MELRLKAGEYIILTNNSHNNIMCLLNVNLGKLERNLSTCKRRIKSNLRLSDIKNGCGPLN